MDKQNLISKIQSSQVPQELKDELLETVQSAPEADQNLVVQLRKVIDDYNVDLINQDATEKIQEETQKFLAQMAIREKELNQIGDEINQQADQIDLEEARKKVAGS